MVLKKMAIEAGLDVPLYIKTGWPAMRTPVSLGELLPLFGAYPDGFWERSLKPMDGSSWENFIFKRTRTDTGVGNDTLGNQKDGDTAGTEKYPHLTCEVGGGMPASYHRRMNYDPCDMEAVVMTQLGSGSSLLGYYMYHGGQNPEGKLSTLQESQATGYPNDLPVKTYDFNAPIGEFGQINPQYYWLRRLHLFLHDFGAPLAQMPLTLPDVLVAGKNDFDTLRWAVRSDGNSGYVFVNNYQRLQPMTEKRDVQFKLTLPGGELVFPQKPVAVPADGFFFWPFNLNFAGVNLDYATAEPICMVEEGEAQTLYFAETPGVKAEFSFTVLIPGSNAMEPSRTEFHNVKPGRKPAFSLNNRIGEKIQIVLLSEADSLAMHKDAAGRVVFDEKPKVSVTKVKTEMLQPARPAREIALSSGKSHIAIAPGDDDFTNATVWKITLPGKLDLERNPMLRIHYVGDVARLTLNGKLIEDNFYAGRTFDLGLKRYAPEIFTGDLRLEILPLRKDAPVYIEPKDRPDFAGRKRFVSRRRGRWSGTSECLKNHPGGFMLRSPSPLRPSPRWEKGQPLGIIGSLEVPEQKSGCGFAE